WFETAVAAGDEPCSAQYADQRPVHDQAGSGGGPTSLFPCPQRDRGILPRLERAAGAQRGGDAEAAASDLSQQFGACADFMDQLIEFSTGARIQLLMPLRENEFVLQRMFQPGQFRHTYLVAMRFQIKPTQHLGE